MTATSQEALETCTGNDGLELFYRDFAGPSDRVPVVCLPGLTRNSRDFEELNPHLAKTRRVLSPDLRGRGFSARDPDWRNYHPMQYVDDIWKLLDDNGIERVALIGTSLGGLMSMIMGAQMPERIVGMVLNDIGPEIDPTGLARISAYAGKLADVSSWEEARAQAKEVYGSAWLDLDDATWEKIARRGYREITPGKPETDVDANVGRALIEVGATGPDPWDVFNATTSIPTLLLRGALSDILAPATVRKMQDAHPDLVFVEVPNRGHVPLLDEQESLDAIDQFLEQLP